MATPKTLDKGLSKSHKRPHAEGIQDLPDNKRTKLTAGSRLPQGSYIAGQNEGYRSVAILREASETTNSMGPITLGTSHQAQLIEEEADTDAPVADASGPGPHTNLVNQAASSTALVSHAHLATPDANVDIPAPTTTARKPRVNVRKYNHSLRGTVADKYDWELPDLPAGMQYNWTAAEILAYLPKLARNPNIARRLQFNGINNRIHQRMVAEFRAGIGPVNGKYGMKQRALANEAYSDPTIRRQYEAAMRQILPPHNGTKWTNVNTGLFKPRNWDDLHGGDISMNDYMSGRGANPNRNTSKSVKLLDLLKGVVNPPTGDDTADLTRVLDFAKANPRPKHNQYMFPDSLPEIMQAIGMSTITAKQHDSSIFSRYPAAVREAQGTPHADELDEETVGPATPQAVNYQPLSVDDQAYLAALMNSSSRSQTYDDQGVPQAQQAQRPFYPLPADGSAQSQHLMNAPATAQYPRAQAPPYYASNETNGWQNGNTVDTGLPDPRLFPHQPGFEQMASELQQLWNSLLDPSAPDLFFNGSSSAEGADVSAEDPNALWFPESFVDAPMAEQLNLPQSVHFQEAFVAEDGVGATPDNIYPEVFGRPFYLLDDNGQRVYGGADEAL